MADVTSGASAQTFSNPTDNARDMADQILNDLDAGVPDQVAGDAFDQEMGWDSGDGRDQEAYDLGFSDENPSDLDSESAGVTETSPGSGLPSPAPAPQLDPTTQLLMQQVQSMQQIQAQRDAQFAQMLERFAPKPEPAKPADPFEGMDPELRGEIEANPKLKALIEWQAKQAAAPASKLQQELEQRIQQATFQREVQQFSTEADQVAQSVISSGFKFEPGEDRIVGDLLRDMSLALSNKDVHGGTPAKFAAPLKAAFDKAVNARIRHLNSQAKAKVGPRNPAAPAQARSQSGGPGIPQGQKRTPTADDFRRAGYKSPMEAALDGDRKVHAMWAKEGRR